MKFKKLLFVSGICGAVLALSGCDSNNVRSYNPDLVLANSIQQQLAHPIHVTGVSLQDGDQNAILCRLAGDIYLPDKMTYSQYIKQALEAELIAANRYNNSSPAYINIQLSSVNFSTVDGTWSISGTVYVNQNPGVSISSTSDFGTAFTGWTACKNAADGFRPAVREFASNVLSNPTIVAELNAVPPVKS